MLLELPPQLHEFMFKALRLCLWLAILVVVFVPLEYAFAVQPKKLFRKGLAADLMYYFLSSLLPAVILAAPIGLVAAAARAGEPAGFLAIMAGLPLWARASLGLLAGEIGYYWGHRLSHEVPFLWGFHAIHHSAEHVDFLVNTRAHPVDLVFGKFCALIPMYILGLAGPVGARGSEVPVIVALAGTTWGFFIHANVRWRLGPLEWLVTTPAFHHWHHTLGGPINRNYASTFPWLDRLFGTHHLPRDFPAAYGIEAKIPEGVIGQFVYPLKAPAGAERIEAGDGA